MVQLEIRLLQKKKGLATNFCVIICDRLDLKLENVYANIVFVLFCFLFFVLFYVYLPRALLQPP